MSLTINIAGYTSIDKCDQQWNCKQEYVFITDSYGIHQIFIQLKDRLYNASKCFLSLLYIPRESILPCPYKKELEYLEKRFQTHLFLNLVESRDALILGNSMLEVIINSSCIENQQFIVSGEHDFVTYVVDQLLFLSIDKNKINIQVIKK